MLRQVTRRELKATGESRVAISVGQNNNTRKVSGIGYSDEFGNMSMSKLAIYEPSFVQEPLMRGLREKNLVSL